MADKPIYRGKKLNFMGIPRRMGQLTDEHIRDFYDMQKRDGYAEEAIEELVRTERKSREEIEVICGVRKDEKMIDKETKAKLISDAADGMSCKQLADKYHMNSKAVGYHLTEARKNGQIPPPKNAAPKKAALHSDSESPSKKPTEHYSIKSSTWYALLEQLEAFALLAFGDETVVDNCTVSTENKMARLGVLTKGKKVQITIEEYSE